MRNFTIIVHRSFVGDVRRALGTEETAKPSESVNGDRGVLTDGNWDERGMGGGNEGHEANEEARHDENTTPINRWEDVRDIWS